MYALAYRGFESNHLRQVFLLFHCLTPQQDIRTDIFRSGQTREGHRKVDFATENFQRVCHAGFAARSKAPELGPADQAAISAERQRLDDMAAAPDAALPLARAGL